MNCQECKRKLSFKDMAKFHTWCRNCYYKKVEEEIFKLIEQWAKLIKIDFGESDHENS